MEDDCPHVHVQHDRDHTDRFGSQLSLSPTAFAWQLSDFCVCFFPPFFLIFFSFLLHVLCFGLFLPPFKFFLYCVFSVKHSLIHVIGFNSFSGERRFDDGWNTEPNSLLPLGDVFNKNKDWQTLSSTAHLFVWQQCKYHYTCKDEPASDHSTHYRINLEPLSGNILMRRVYTCFTNAYKSSTKKVLLMFKPPKPCPLSGLRHSFRYPFPDSCLFICFTYTVIWVVACPSVHRAENREIFYTDQTTSQSQDRTKFTTLTNLVSTFPEWLSFDL